MASFCLDQTMHKHFHFRNNMDVSSGYLCKYSQLTCNNMHNNPFTPCSNAELMCQKVDQHSYIKIWF